MLEHTTLKPTPRYIVLITHLCWLIASMSAHSQVLDDDIMRQMRSMSHRNHDLVGIYYDRDFAEHVAPLHTLARDTILELEQAWGVTLPRNQFQIYLHFVQNSSDDYVFQQLPPWVNTRTQAERGELHYYIYPFSDFEQSAIQDLLPFQLTYMIIRHLNTKLSDPLTAGIARQHHPFSGGRQLFIGISAMQAQTDPFSLLQKAASELTTSQKLEASVLGAYFTEWLFLAHPANQSTFMQQVLQNQDLRTCLAQIGQEDFVKLEDPFSEAMHTQLAYTNLIKTLDFWLLIIGILLLAGILWYLIATLKFALSEDAGIETAPSMQTKTLVDEAEFKGPAFGKAAAAPKAAENQTQQESEKASLPPRPPKAKQPKPPPVHEPEPQWETDSEILSVDGVVWEEEPSRPQTQSVKPPKPQEQPTTQQPQQQKRPPKIQPPKLPKPEAAPKPAQEDWESDIDNIFDDLVLGNDDR